MLLFFTSLPGEPVLGPSKTRPLGAVRTEPGGLKSHDAGFYSGSETRDQLSFSSSRQTQHSSEYIHPIQYLLLCCQIHHVMDIPYESMNLFTLSSANKKPRPSGKTAVSQDSLPSGRQVPPAGKTEAIKTMSRNQNPYESA